MYCRFCGKQIDDDSIFCVHCGKNTRALPQPEIQPVVSPEREPEEKPESSMLWVLWLIFAIIIIIVCAISIAGVTSSNESDSTSISNAVSNNLKDSDYSYTTSQDLTAYRITLTPNRDIKSCDIKLTLYNSKGESIFSDTISKIDLKKGNSYTYTFDFGYVNAFSGSQVKYTITGKRK